MMGVWIAAGLVVGAGIRGDWSLVVGAFMGFAVGGLFYERMKARIDERRAREKRARFEALFESREP